MLRRLVPTLLTLCACQQAPASAIDVAVADTVRAPVAAMPSSRDTTAAPSAPVAPQRERPTMHVPLRPVTPFSLTAATVISPAGAVQKSLVDSVTIGVDLMGAAPGELAVEFFAPNGMSYQRRTASVQGGTEAAQHFDFELPVAGTWIDSSSITGQWTARIFFQGEEKLSQGFDIEP